MKLTVLADTVLKPSAEQSSSLPEDAIARVAKGTELPVLAYRQEGSHVVITIDPSSYDLKALHPSGKNTWYAFDQHLEDPEGMGPDNTPQDEAAESPRDRGVEFTLPGFAGVYHSGDRVSSEAPSFTWAEALHFSGSNYRRPASASVVYGILRIAPALQEIRGMYGDRPIIINSWHRDPVTNRQVGGASQSRHMRGDAVDFRIPGVSPYAIYERLDSWWGNRGGLASSSVFTHIDARGYRARWSYGF
jgi:hypothetical protein